MLGSGSENTAELGPGIQLGSALRSRAGGVIVLITRTNQLYGAAKLRAITGQLSTARVKLSLGAGCVCRSLQHDTIHVVQDMLPLLPPRNDRDRKLSRVTEPDQ